TLTLEFTIISQNTAAMCAGPGINDAGHNITFPVSLTNGCPGTQADPQLLALGDNGGPTQTRALGPMSPAIDVGACGPGRSDSRRARRPSAACDAGAYEFAPPTVTADPAADVTTTSATLAAHVNPNARATSVVFEYGPTAAHGSSTGSVSL